MLQAAGVRLPLGPCPKLGAAGGEAAGLRAPSWGRTSRQGDTCSAAALPRRSPAPSAGRRAGPCPVSPRPRRGPRWGGRA